MEERKMHFCRLFKMHFFEDFRWTTAFLVGLLIFNFPVSCGNHASIKSEYGQLVTSSTLQWQHFTQNDLRRQIPANAVQSGKGSKHHVVCRAEHHGSLLVGQTKTNGACEVAFVSKVFKKHTFEVLLNVDQAAKLEWRPFTKFMAVPKGAVAAVDTDEDIFIGRHLDPKTGGYLPGGIQVQTAAYSFGAMVVFDGQGSVKEVSHGEVMVEVEPVSYELELHADLTSRPKVTRNDVVLAKSSLFRFDEGRDKDARLQKVLAYSYETSEYYGQIPGMIRALPAIVRIHDGRVHSTLWGLPETKEKEETLMVGHSLRHQSAVDVSIVGVRVVEEHNYRGTLTSVFPGGARRQRKVEGLLQKKYLNNIRPEYSRVYKIKDSVTARPQTKTTSLPRLRTYPPTRKWSADSSGDGTNLRRDLMFSNDQRKEKPSPVISQNSAQTLSRETILLQIGLLLSVLFQL